MLAEHHVVVSLMHVRLIVVVVSFIIILWQCFCLVCSVSLFSPFVVYVVSHLCSPIGGACIRGAYWREQCGVIGHAGVTEGQRGDTLHAPCTELAVYDALLYDLIR